MKKKYEVVGKLCIELGEVMVKLDKLERFLESDNFVENLSVRQQEIMMDQLDILKDYATVLGRRIEDLT